MMQENLIDNDLRIDDLSAMSLNETAKWARFLAIVGFVLTGLIVLVAIFAGSILASLPMNNGQNAVIAGMGTGFLTVLYLIIGAIYFFMSLFLYRFATNMKIAITSTSQKNLNTSFHNLKNVYKIMGIVTIVYLAFIALFIILAIAGTVFMSR